MSGNGFSLAYTDGARSGMGIGWACEIDNVMISGSRYGGTNNQAEIMAIIEAVSHCQPNTQLTIVTDSKLAIGLLKWGWKTEHEHLLGMIDAYHVHRTERNIDVKFVKVKGHSDNAGNNRVDLVAHRLAVKERKKPRR